MQGIEDGGVLDPVTFGPYWPSGSRLLRDRHGFVAFDASVEEFTSVRVERSFTGFKKADRAEQTAVAALIEPRPAASGVDLDQPRLGRLTEPANPAPRRKRESFRAVAALPKPSGAGTALTMREKRAT